MKVAVIKSKPVLIAAAVFVLLGTAGGAMAASQPGTTELISVSSASVQGNGASHPASISGDGRYVAFRSAASNLVSGDTNGTNDIFVHDLQTETTERISVSSSGEQSNGESDAPSLSMAGRYIAFHSFADNLVSGDNNGAADIFVYDRQNTTIQRVSVSSSGTEGNFHSFRPSISADGRYVAFQTSATNLEGEDTNGVWDVYLHDRQSGVTERVSISSVGEQGNFDSSYASISADGRFVAFSSSANTLVSGDTNGKADVFIRDRQSGTTERISVSNSGEQGNDSSLAPSITSDGRHVAFFSYASNIVSGDTNEFGDIFVHDRLTSETTRVSVSDSGEQGNEYSYTSSISADGRYVSFQSLANNLISGDTNEEIDTFLHDRLAGTTQRVSVSTSGEEGNGESLISTISADGRYVTFQSLATNLVAGDTNGVWDVFVHVRCPGGACFDQSVYLPLVIR